MTTVCHVLPFDIILLMFQIIWNSLCAIISPFVLLYFQNYVKSHCGYHNSRSIHDKFCGILFRFLSYGFDDPDNEVKIFIPLK